MTIEKIIALSFASFLAFCLLLFLLNLFYCLLMQEFPHDTFKRWKKKHIDEPKKQKRRELYLAPVFENHKYKKIQMEKTVYVRHASFVDKKKKAVNGYLFEVFQRNGTRFYSKGFHFFYFQSTQDHEQFLSIFSKYNEKNPYTDNDLLLHVKMSKPWDEPDNHIDRVIKYHSHNKTY